MRISTKILGESKTKPWAEWQKRAWRVLLRCGNRKYTCDIFTSGHEPSTGEIIDCLLAECSLFGMTYDEWHTQLGIDDRVAYEVNQKVGENMRRLVS